MPDGVESIMGPGASPMGGPGPGGNPMADMALSALDGISPKSPNPKTALDRIEEGINIAHRVVQSILPQVQSFNPKIAKDLHGIGRQLMSLKLDLHKERPVSPPPAMMMGGMAGALGPGSPGPGAPTGGPY